MKIIESLKKRRSYYSIGKELPVSEAQVTALVEKLAELVDLSLSSISRLETGRTMVSVEKLLRIADALNVGIDELLADFIQGAKPEERLMNRVSVLLALCSKEEQAYWVDNLQMFIEYVKGQK